MIKHIIKIKDNCVNFAPCHLMRMRYHISDLTDFTWCFKDSAIIVFPSISAMIKFRFLFV